MVMGLCKNSQHSQISYPPHVLSLCFVCFKAVIITPVETAWFEQLGDVCASLLASFVQAFGESD